jgi:hypothetical protein
VRNEDVRNAIVFDGAPDHLLLLHDIVHVGDKLPFMLTQILGTLMIGLKQFLPAAPPPA